MATRRLAQTIRAVARTRPKKKKPAIPRSGAE